MHDPTAPRRGVAVLAVLVTATAVLAAGLILAPSGSDDPRGPAAFSDGDTGDAALCSGPGAGEVTTDGPQSIQWVATCDDGHLDAVDLVLQRDGTDVAVVASITADGGGLTVETATGTVTRAVDADDLVVEETPSGLEVVDGAAGDVGDAIDTGPDPVATVLQVGDQVLVDVPGGPGLDDDGDEHHVASAVLGQDGVVFTTVEVLLGDGEDLQAALQETQTAAEAQVQSQRGTALAAVDAAPGPGDEASATVRAGDRVLDVDADGTQLTVDGLLSGEPRLVVEDDGAEVAALDVEESTDDAPALAGVAAALPDETRVVTDEVTFVRDGSGTLQSVALPDPPPAAGNLVALSDAAAEAPGPVAAEVTRVAGDDWRVRPADVTATAPEVVVETSPAAVDVETAVRLLDGTGGPVATVEVVIPGEGLVDGRTQVDVTDHADEVGETDTVTTVVAGLLRVEEGADGTPRNVTVFPADGPALSSLTLAKDGGTWTFSTPLASATVQGSDPTVAGDASDPHLVHVLLRDADGNDVVRVDVDGDPANPTASYDAPEVGSGEVSPPVAYEGSPADLQALQVTGPDGDPLLTYTEDGTDATVAVPPADETRTVDRRAVRLEGHPAADDEWTLAVRDPHGESPTRYTVNRPNYKEAARSADAGTPSDLGPVVSVVDEGPEADGETEFLDWVADGVRNESDASRLDGSVWMSGLRPLTFDASFPDSTVHDRFYVRYSAKADVPLDAPTVALEAEDGSGNRSGSVVLGDAGGAWDDETLRFEVVAERRVGDGLVAFARVDNRTVAPYAVLVDAAPPTAQVSSPSDPGGPTWLVTWDGTDAASGVVEFEVAKEPNGGSWETWIERTTGRSKQFSAQPDIPYRFKARATDHVGHTSPWSTAAESLYEAPDDGGGTDDGGSDDTDGGDTVENQAPTVTLLEPAADADVEGIVEVQWTASDPDGTAPAINAYVSPDGGTTWEALRTNSDRAYWDTAEYPDGTGYQLKVVADDGTLTAEEVVTGVAVDNEEATTPDGSGGASPGAGDGGDGSADGGDGSGGDDGGNGVPGPGPAAFVAATGAAAALRRRR